MIIEGVLAVFGMAGIALWRSRSAIKPSTAGNSVETPSPEQPSAAANKEPERPSVGEQIGRYRIEDYLGEGGMALVYRVSETTDPSNCYALKLIKDEYVGDQDFRKRFEREISVCKELEHPNIVKLLDWGEERGLLFLVLEYVKGRELGEVLKGEPVALPTALPNIDGLISGLEYAHNKGVVHRDLKPSNIMVNEAGEIKIMDFGLARTEDTEKVTRTGDSMGTPAYLPPEQITGAVPNPKADQYSLGVIFYEMLTGRRPFGEKNPLKLMMQHLKEAPPDPLSVNQELPVTAGEILMRMLEKSPEKRFSSLSLVAEGFQSIARGEKWELPQQQSTPPAAERPEVEIRIVEEPSDDDETMGFQVSS